MQITSGRYSLAAVVKIINAGTEEVNLVAFTDGVNPWPTVDVFNGIVDGAYANVAKGTGVGQWQELAVPQNIQDAIADAVSDILASYATESYVDAATAACCAVPAAGSSVSSPALSSPALSSPRRPSTTRPTRVTVYADVALTSTLLAAQSATVELRADSSSTPTTAVGGPQTASLGGIAASATIPMTLTYDLPVGHYYTVVQTAGAGAVTITRIEETTL